MHRSSLLLPLLVALLAPAGLAQLNLSFVTSFVDTFPGGLGNIGVTQDEVDLNHYVLAFNNPQTVHSFDLAGQPLVMFTSTGCVPAAPTPNDITYDPFRDVLWLVDNDSPGRVVKLGRQGACLGGFNLPIVVSNPVGITFDRNRGTLFVSHTGGVIEVSTAGALLGGGFSFVPSGGSAILSGITYVPATDRFLLTQSSGNRVFEVDRTGALVSTTALSSFGVVNTQGLHYNPLLQRLLVVDNSQSRTYVFDLPFCNGSLVHRGLGCADAGGATLVLGATGCATPGAGLQLQAHASAGALPLFFAGGVSNTAFGPFPLPLGLDTFAGPPACTLFMSGEAIVGVPMVGTLATLPFLIPANPQLVGATVFLQAFKYDPGLPFTTPIASSNAIDVTVF